jgi:ribosomal protein S4
VQLREKQKAQRYYGVLEKQFRHYYEKASRQEGITGENLLTLLERRFDNVLVRLGFAASRRQARQLIRHGHWTINGRRVDIPSYQVRDGDVIAVKVGTGADAVIRDATELTAQVPAWLQADHDALTAKVLRKPERREITTPVRSSSSSSCTRSRGTPEPRHTEARAAASPFAWRAVKRQSGPRCSTSRSPASPPNTWRRTAARSPSSRWTADSATRSATRCGECC